MFTERTEEAWGRAPAVGGAAAEPVPGGRGMGDDLRQSVLQPLREQTVGPGNCSDH